MRSFVPAVVARADVAAPPSGPESGRAEEGGTLPPSSSPPSLRPPRSSPSLRPAGNSVQPRCARASRPREYERSCATQRIRKIFPRGAARGRIRPPACGRRGGGGGARILFAGPRRAALHAHHAHHAHHGGPPLEGLPSFGCRKGSLLRLPAKGPTAMFNMAISYALTSGHEGDNAVAPPGGVLPLLLALLL